MTSMIGITQEIIVQRRASILAGTSPNPRADACKRGKHNWISTSNTHRRYDATGRTHPVGELWRYCNFCYTEDHETRLCEAVLTKDWSTWTCGKTAKTQETDEHGRLYGLREGAHWYCSTHSPARLAEAAAKRQAAYDAEWAAKRAGWEREARDRERLTRIPELLEWADKNADLLEADEWLGRIIRDIRGK